jgi:membrane protein
MYRMRKRPGPAQTAVRLARNLLRDDTLSLAAQTAFYLILSLCPLLLFMISALRDMQLPADGTLAALFPESVRSSLAFLLSDAPDTPPNGLWGTLVSLWSGSAALWALMRGVFQAMQDDPRKSPPFWARLISPLFLAGFTAAVGLSALLAVFGRRLAERMGLTWPWLAGLAPRVGVTAGLFGFALLLYRFTPGVGRRLRQLWPGALLAAVGWSLASLLFELYITWFAPFGTLYGGLGAFLGLALWLYVVSAAILTGAELNAVTGTAPEP